MKFHKTPIEGVVLIEPQVFGDDRGFFEYLVHHRGASASCRGGADSDSGGAGGEDRRRGGRGRHRAGGMPLNLPLDWVMAPYNDIDACLALIRQHREDLAAILTKNRCGG